MRKRSYTRSRTILRIGDIMVYWICLYEEYRGYYAPSRHATLKNALAALRRKMVIGNADAGLILTSEPPKIATDSYPKSLVGVMNARASGGKRVGIVMNGRKMLVPGNMYIYSERVKGKRLDDWPTYQVMSDGTKRKI